MTWIIIFVVVALIPVVGAFGVIIWGAASHQTEDAFGLMRSVALGLIFGAVGGAIVGVILIAAVLGIKHLRGQ